MKLLKKVLIPFALSTVLIFSACSSTGGTGTVSESKATETTIALEKEVVSETTAALSLNETSISTTVSEGQTTILSGTEATTATKEINPINEKMYVHFIDVGQGDSIFIELPNGESMLVDAAEDDQADKIITYIHQQGYNSLDYVVATHPHSDHIGGMANVINNFSVKNFYMTSVLSTTKTYENMLTAINNSGAKVHNVMAGDVILDDGNLLIEVVAPKALECDDLNSTSVVIKLTYGENSFLFTGDAEKDEEDGIWTNIKCDVLKVGHHGSDSSSTANFLKKVESTYAVISVGTGNSYGHPTDSTLQRLAQRNIKVFRTDIQGTIVFTSDGTNITVDKSPSEYTSPTETTITTTRQAASMVVSGKYKYVLNINTMKIHYADCSSVKKMKEENKSYTNDYVQAITDGYKPCGNCHSVG